MRLIDADALIEFCAERWIPLNIDAVNMQPTIQPEKEQLSCEGTTPAIPLTWIWKYIKWLQSLGNVLADQAGAHILAMVHKWGDEQDETD